jgi:hypothetical protein
MEYTLYETKELAHRLCCPKFPNLGHLGHLYLFRHFPFLISRL